MTKTKTKKRKYTKGAGFYKRYPHLKPKTAIAKAFEKAREEQRVRGLKADAKKQRKAKPLKRATRKRILVDSVTGKPVAMLKNNAIVLNYKKKPYTRTAKWYKAHDKRTIELEFLQWLINHEVMHVIASANRSVYVPKPGRPSKRDIAMRYLTGLVGGKKKQGRPITAKGLLRLLKD